MRMRAVLAAGGVLAAGVVGSLATAVPAQAAMSDICGGRFGNEFCLYYNSYQKGGAAGATSDVANWDNFGGTGYPLNFADWGLGTAGVGQHVKNNAASYANSAWSKTGASYYNSNFSGAYDLAAPQTKGQLVNTYNENASFRWR
ncbi:hypothetical protein RKD23_004556 [Streptomyces sp. SAI-170]